MKPRIRLEGDVFFGEEMTFIGSIQKEVGGEKVLREIFERDDKSFVVKNSYIDRGNPDPSYDIFTEETLNIVAAYILAQK